MPSGGATATVMTWFEMRLNPSGIFHGPAGTNWSFVWETWISWFLPTFGLVAVLMLPLVIRRLYRLRSVSTAGGRSMGELAAPPIDLQAHRSRAEQANVERDPRRSP